MHKKKNRCGATVFSLLAFLFLKKSLTKYLINDSGIFLTQLETNINVIENAIVYAKRSGNLVVFNPAPIQGFNKDILKYVDIITPNEIEASILTGIEINSYKDANNAAILLQQMGVNIVLITLGEKGVLLKTKETTKIIKGFNVEVVDTTGAGDAFNGGFITALADGKTLEEASIFANAVAALSVMRVGTSPAMPNRAEVEKFLSSRSETVEICELDME